MKHSIELHRRLYKYLRGNQMFEHRRDIVYQFTNGRTDNSAEMTTAEISKMIKYVQSHAERGNLDSSDFIKGDRMRKRILSLSHQYGWTEYDPEKQKMVVDFERLDNWMLKYSYLKKKLNQYKYSELPKLVSQFQEFVHKYINQV